MMPPLLMPVAYTLRGSIGTWCAMADTIALMNATSAPVLPGTPQHPPPVSHARSSPFG